MCVRLCPWIYSVVIRNNTLPEATVYITDRQAFIVWFLLNGIVILNKYLLVGCVWSSLLTQTQMEKMSAKEKMILPALMKVLKLTENENDLCAGVA